MVHEVRRNNTLKTGGIGDSIANNSDRKVAVGGK